MFYGSITMGLHFSVVRKDMTKKKKKKKKKIKIELFNKPTNILILKLQLGIKDWF